ncbi:isocitrate lyase/PEP mutase family protein [Piscinibacter koreensis]|uniref:Oxaloacetate decarboxylase n=1 Tax=Piscinibacter koreensis TaxID=2742824 RepID=A0A7Y6NMW6_9BURK|nr:oxaloacetate decarboxylase [Schlegelella koreensis]NUZ06121.1 oxaloacetate decarboxylase [Schlegelella koreensis]
MSSSSHRTLADLLSPGAGLVIPGAANALAARMVEDAGFPVVYLTGAGIANSWLGAPDMGLTTATEVAAHIAACREAVTIPIVADGDTGFGNAMNLVRTVRLFERAGADAIQLEDQVFPKRCGHFDGKAVIPAAAMVQKIKAAVDARADARLLVIARTDARAVEGFDAAIDRAAAYREAGADVLFVEAPASEAELRAIPERLPGPHLCNVVHGGKTPMLPRAVLAGIGYAGILYANAALQAAMLAMQKTLAHLAREGSLAGIEDTLIGFPERQAAVDMARWSGIERRYAEP